MSTPYLLNYYREKVVPALREKHGYKNPHQVPKLEKIVLSTCMGKADNRNAAVEDALIDLAKITGQRPAVTRAKKSVANFKLRAGENLGARVTLRGERMWDFLYRFINITAPNVRDFRGLSPRGFDGRGNFAIGFPELTIFPEIELDQIKRQIGFDLIIVTTAKTDEEGRSLLTELGMPFREHKPKQEGDAA